MDYRLVSAVPNPVLIISLPSARVLHLNPAARREWGYDATLDEIRDLGSLLAPADESNASALATFLAGHDRLFVRLAADVTSADGRQRRYQFVARAGVEGEQDVGLLAAVDASEQDALFLALANDALRLRALVESNFDAYYVWHETGRYHEWSTQMDSLLGLLPGTDPYGEDAWIARLHPSQREAVISRIRTTLDEGRRFYEDEYRLRRDDGEYLLVADRGVVLFDDQGRSSELVGVIRDITKERAIHVALEESEELYRTLFQATTNPALRTDEKGRCIEANQAACKLLGLSNESLSRTTIGDHFGSQATETLEQFSMAETEFPEAVTVELKTGEGDEERILVTSVIPSTVGDRVTYFWLATDVTRLRRLNTALEESRQSLETEMKARAEYSVALRVIIEQGRQERLDMGRAIRDNFDRLIVPMLERLDRFLTGRPEAAYLDAIRYTVEEIANSVGGSDSDSSDLMQARLTRKEVEVARLVKMGKSTDEIAAILHTSSATVSYHRKKIRGKFGITKKKVRLNQYLLDAEAND